MMILMHRRALSSFSTFSKLRAVDIKDDSCGFSGSVRGRRCKNASSVFRKRCQRKRNSDRCRTRRAQGHLTCSGGSRKKTTGGPVSRSIAVIGGIRVLRKTAKAPGSLDASALSLSSDAEPKQYSVRALVISDS
jgi:hypothetical protein